MNRSTLIFDFSCIILAFAFPFFTPYFVPFRIVICPALRDKFCVRFVFVLPCKTLGPAQGEPTTGTWTWTATETRDQGPETGIGTRIEQDNAVLTAVEAFVSMLWESGQESRQRWKKTKR